MSITAADNNPVLITVDTTATTDGRTDNVATPFTADTRAWRYNDGIVATISGGASVTGFGLEFEPQGGHVVTVDLEAGAGISQTLLPANTTGTDALSLIGSGNNVTYIGNGTVSSTVASGVVLTQTQAGAGDLIANVNNNISTTANGSVGALIVDQVAASGTGNVTVNLAGDVTVSQTGDADTYGGIFAKARGTGGNASVTLGSTIGTSTVLANGTGIAGVHADSLAGVASVLNGLGTSSISVTGSGSNSGIFAASGAKTISTHAVLVTTGANSTISVTGGDDNSGIFARNYTDDPNTGNDVVSTGNITITASSGSTITVGSPGAANQEGIGAYTHAVTGTATDITVVASIGGSISVTGNTAAGINARQQAAGGTGDVTVTTNSGRTIDITDTVSGSASFGIHATNAGSGLVSVTSASTITATGVGASDIVGISASGNAGVIVNMPDGLIGTNSDRVGMGIDAAANGASGDIDVTAAAIFSSGDAVRADASTAGNIHITVNGALDASNGIGVHLIGGTDNTIDSTAAISGSVGVQVNGGTTTLTAGANITGTAFALDITGGTLVLQGTGISDLGNVHNDGVFDVNRNEAFTIGGVISGSGDFQQNGIGITNLNGANTYTGETFLNAGTTGLNSNTSLGATGAGAGTTAADAAILAYAPGVTIAEAITLAGATLGVTFDQTGGSAMQSGVIDGTGPLNKTGIGTLIFTNIATYTGPTNVNAGTLQVDGSIVNSATTVHSGGTLAGSGTTGAVTVQSGGTLAGSGTTGAVTVESGGTLSPGASPDILTTGNLDLQSGSNFLVEISGATPGLGGYDQVVVNGSVTLAGTLSTSLLASFHPATGSALTIIDNDGSDAVSGTFAGLAEGAQFTQGGSTYSITYAGGDGNDVVLTALNDPAVLANVDPTASYTEKSAPVALDTAPLIAVTDPDGGTLVGATVHITAGTFVGDGDILSAITAGTSITASFDDTTETLTLSGLDSLANYQQVLQSVTFVSTSDTPMNSGANPSRTIEWQLDDGGAVDNLSTVQTTNLAITPANERPFLLNVALTAAYAPGTPGSVLSPALHTGDVDSATYASATVQITDGYLTGDELFVNLPTAGGFFQVDNGAGGLTTTNISVQSNSFGRLVLAGADTPAHYQEVLDAVSYRSTAVDPGNGGHNPTRTISWQVNDGTAASPLFQVPTPFATGTNPTSVAAGDLNGDSIPDLAVTNQSTNDVSILLGHGDGTFAGTPRIAVGGAPESLAIGDLNGDGILDLAVANNATNNVSVLLGNANGTFAGTPPIAVGGA
ncbi:MAG TPA: FG-GAP-like repeat-containing protein, partial [Xanthobacteraceae bacterium]|nr:FG-GAP-like repeat-containing protein [Xanthobacteraceae bacterium]